MIQSPLQLDDRRFDDLVAEAKRRIAARCPGWTDFNPSDPGMALVDLMAWMTDTVLFRLNRIPELNYLALLELMGVQLQPARPARSWVFFTPDPKALPAGQSALVPAGTRLSTRPGGAGDPLQFVTSRDLSLTSARIIAVASHYEAPVTGETRATVVAPLDPKSWPIALFNGGTRVSHELYLGDPGSQDHGARDLRILFDLERAATHPLLLEWEAWDGDGWRTLAPSEDTTQGLSRPGGVRFQSLPNGKATAAAGLEPAVRLPAPTADAGPDPAAFWIRASLLGPASSVAPVVREIRYQTAVPHGTVLPKRAFTGIPAATSRSSQTPMPPGPALLPVEFNQDFQPFGPRMMAGSAFYLDTDLLQKRGATIRIELPLRAPLPLPDVTREELIVHWEYRGPQGQWVELGVVSSSEVVRTRFALSDATGAFTRRDGHIEFICPPDVERSQLQVNAEPGWFIRARVESFKSANPEAAGPTATRVALSFDEQPSAKSTRGGLGRRWQIQAAINDREIHRWAPGTTGTPFVVDPARSPALYLALDSKPDPERPSYQLFLELEDESIARPDTAGAVRWEFDSPLVAVGELTADDIKDPAGLIWRMRHDNGPLIDYLRRQMPADLLARMLSSAAPDRQASALAAALNGVLRQDGFYDPARFQQVQLGPPARLLLSRKANDDIFALNRHLLADAFPREIAPITGWAWRPDRMPSTPGAMVRWEYATSSNDWRPLMVKDGTQHLTRSGFLELDLPRDRWDLTSLFDQPAFWLRARWETGQFASPRVLRRAAFNGVEAEQFVRTERLLGTSDGTPLQTFSLQTAILDDPEVWVSIVPNDPVAERGRAPGDNDAAPVREKDGKRWQRWTEVRINLRSPGPHGALAEAPVYTAELATGTFRFGDDVIGRIPPSGASIAVVFRVTAGAAGNVGPETIVVLDDPVPGLTSVAVTNLHPASGGADREEISSARERGPWEMKHRDRAVTAEDFVQLAKKASAAVGAAECFADNGVAHVVIVPRTTDDRPQPSRQLLDDIRRYLDRRRLINTELQVEGPTYDPIDLEIEVTVEPAWHHRFPEVRAEVERTLRRFVHPLFGAQGSGWPVGRSLHVSELYYCLERLDGVDHVHQVRMRRAGTESWAATRIALEARAYPCFSRHLVIKPVQD